MIPRKITESLRKSLGQFPVVSLTGPRQSGKTTLLKNEFPEFTYLSMEDPDVRSFASEDPRLFLSHYGRKTIIDEAQRVPELFSYLQGWVDETGEPGQYIVSGSQNFLLMKTISQSLAGRVAIRHLPPLSYSELKEAGMQPATIGEWVLKGGYPRLYDVHVDPVEYYSSYIQTYIDRDVRLESGVVKVSEFDRFVSLCATRIGNLLNLKSLANDCDINERTAKEWLSVLEQSFIVYLLKPYYRNLGKRIIKTPKLYFSDTGLASALLGLENSEELVANNLFGPLFENAVIAELLKKSAAAGRAPDLYFWRDSNGNEIDLLEIKGAGVKRAIEVKSSTTYNPKSFATMDSLRDELGIDIHQCEVVYSGDTTMETKHGLLRAYKDL